MVQHSGGKAIWKLAHPHWVRVAVAWGWLSAWTSMRALQVYSLKYIWHHTVIIITITILSSFMILNQTWCHLNLNSRYYFDMFLWSRTLNNLMKFVFLNVENVKTKFWFWNLPRPGNDNHVRPWGKRNTGLIEWSSKEMCPIQKLKVNIFIFPPINVPLCFSWGNYLICTGSDE